MLRSAITAFAIPRKISKSLLMSFVANPKRPELLSTCPWSNVRRHLGTTCRYFKRNVTELTSVRYPHLQRGEYAELGSADIETFRSLLPDDGQILTGEEAIGYNTDWLRVARGNSQLVLRPKTTAQVSGILEYCNSRCLAVCPQGGNTGLVGGSVPVFDEVVLSTQLMKNVIDVDANAGILVCQSGCILETLDNILAEHDLMMPLDLGAKGSCHIGGNVSTNAGGLRLLRYGSLHGSVLGVEAVLANGEVLDCLTSLRKDNTGYDLKQLMIGSEGTLGVVTAVSVLCPQRPAAVNVAFLGCSTFDEVLQILREARSKLGEILSAFELVDSASLECTVNNLKLSSPLSLWPFYVLVETSGSNSGHDEEKLQGFLDSTMGSGLVKDGVIATEFAKMRGLWELRERGAEALLVDGYCYKYDVSLPLTHYYDLVEVMRERLKGHVTRVVAYGHVGDGNLHFNVTTPEYSREVHQMIEPFIYEYVSEQRGSISAEHGLGLLKNKYIGYSKSKAAVTVMRNLKEMFDPNGILNPYKTLPPQDES